MKKLLVLVVFCLSIITSTVYAKSIKMYEKPDVKSHVVSVLKPGQQLLPIYYPKQGDWVKVANPKNGNVGWVQMSDFTAPTNLPNNQKTQQNNNNRASNTNDPNAPQAIDPQQIDQAMKQFQQKATQMQESMQVIMKNLVEQINAMQKTFGDEEDANGNNNPQMNKMLIVPEADSQKE